MTLTINGEPRELADDLSISALLESLGLGGKPVVVELNQEALSPSEFNKKSSDGDKLELITIAAGG
ncbi:MAG: sulfur carrier protein ThiS [Akkermansiaceae bacterium]